MSRGKAWYCTNHMINTMLQQGAPPDRCGTPNNSASPYASKIAIGVGAATMPPGGIRVPPVLFTLGLPLTIAVRCVR